MVQTTLCSSFKQECKTGYFPKRSHTNAHANGAVQGLIYLMVNFLRRKLDGFDFR